MTIKSKLIANLLLTSVIIFAICLGGYSSLQFIQDRFSYIAQKSTPYQVTTLQLESELQRCVTKLLRVNSAQNIDDFRKLRSNAELALKDVKKAENLLIQLNNRKIDQSVSKEFDKIGSEIFTATEARILSETAANDANARVVLIVKDSTEKMQKLDINIRELQKNRAATFARTLQNSRELSSRLRRAEDMRNVVKDLQNAINSAYKSDTRNKLLINKGKVNTVLKRIQSNKFASDVKFDIARVQNDANEFLEMQTEVVVNKNDSVKPWVKIAFEELIENNDRFHLTLNQEITLLTNRFENESKQEGTIFAESNNANIILLHDAELVANALTVAGKINQLVSIKEPKELDLSEFEIKNFFPLMHQHATNIKNILNELGAKDELATLQSAHVSLETLRTEFLSTDGIVSALRKKLTSIKQADIAFNKLNEIAATIVNQGKNDILQAGIELNKSTESVNNTIQTTISRIALSGAVAIVIGILFGLWILFSVLKPLEIIMTAVKNQKEQGIEKAALAEAVSRGKLDLEVNIETPLSFEIIKSGKDEFGAVLYELVEMSKAQTKFDSAFADMTKSLRTNKKNDERRNSLKNALSELNKILRVDHSIYEMSEQALSFVAQYIGAGVGVIYRYDSQREKLIAISTYAVSNFKLLDDGFLTGEGLAGQAAAEKKLIYLNFVPENYLPINSALGNANPLALAILPIMHNETLAGVMELGSFKKFDEDDFDFLNQAVEGIAIAINTYHSRELLNELLEETQSQAEELRVQQEELQRTNEELLERTRILAQQ